MAFNQKKDHQKRSKTTFLPFGCFGCSRDLPSGEEPPRQGGSRRKTSWFRLCLSKLISNNKKRRVSTLNIKEVALNDNKGIKVQLRDYHAPIVKYQLKETVKDTTQLIDHQNLISQSKVDTCHNPNHKGKSKTEFVAKIGPCPKDTGRSFSSYIAREYLIGASLIVVTVMTITLWGRICSILSTSVWFYCMPLLRRSPCRNINVGPNLGPKVQVGSQSHKKVILEGLLQRKS